MLHDAANYGHLQLDCGRKISKNPKSNFLKQSRRASLTSPFLRIQSTRLWNSILAGPHWFRHQRKRPKWSRPKSWSGLQTSPPLGSSSCLTSALLSSPEPVAYHPYECKSLVSDRTASSSTANSPLDATTLSPKRPFVSCWGLFLNLWGRVAFVNDTLVTRVGLHYHLHL